VQPIAWKGSSPKWDIKPYTLIHSHIFLIVAKWDYQSIQGHTSLPVWPWML